MASEEQANQAKKMAEKLVMAHDIMCCSEFIVCDVVDGGKEMTKEYLALLRDYIPSAKENIADVIVALMGGKLAEVE